MSLGLRVIITFSYTKFGEDELRRVSLLPCLVDFTLTISLPLIRLDGSRRGSYFPCLADFCFPDFSILVGVRMACLHMRFLLACISCRFFFTHVYCVPFIFLLGLKFVCFNSLSLVRGLICGKVVALI